MKKTPTVLLMVLLVGALVVGASAFTASASPPVQLKQEVKAPATLLPINSANNTALNANSGTAPPIMDPPKPPDYQNNGFWTNPAVNRYYRWVPF